MTCFYFLNDGMMPELEANEYVIVCVCLKDGGAAVGVGIHWAEDRSTGGAAELAGCADGVVFTLRRVSRHTDANKEEVFQWKKNTEGILSGTVEKNRR